jgi:hypothetical protein
MVKEQHQRQNYITVISPTKIFSGKPNNQVGYNQAYVEKKEPI